MQIMTIFIFIKIFKNVVHIFIFVIIIKFQNGRIFEQGIYIKVVGFKLHSEMRYSYLQEDLPYL